MRNATYDLFSGTSRENAVWMATVEGLEAPADRMSCLALSAPDDYFLFHTVKIVVSVQNDNWHGPATQGVFVREGDRPGVTQANHRFVSRHLSFSELLELCERRCN